jgi:outer membrane protein TolC
VTLRSVLLLFALASGGGACAHYTPAPLDPVANGETLTSRRLDDPGLARYFSDRGAQVPDVWDEDALVLAGEHFQPALDEARARRRAADAALVTAGAPTRPDIEAEAGYGITGTDAVESPWVVALAGVFTLELGGKRGARIGAARARAAAAQLDVAGTAAGIARAVRAAARELDASEGRVEEARQERQATAAIAAAARARYARGEAGRVELSAAEIAALEAEAQQATLEARVPPARTALAAAIGLPAAALDGVRIRATPRRGCAANPPADSLRRLALTQRVEIGGALAAYAIAEADLRVAVAGSYPDLALGPGFTWDQGVGRWSVLFGLPRLPLDGNRGPIAEAVARREAAAAGVSAAQLQVLGEVENAVAECAAARREAVAADSVAAAAEQRFAAARRSYERGETSAADTTAALLPIVRARAAAAAAQRRESGAALALDAAVAGWTGSRYPAIGVSGEDTP